MQYPKLTSHWQKPTKNEKLAIKLKSEAKKNRKPIKEILEKNNFCPYAMDIEYKHYLDENHITCQWLGKVSGTICHDKKNYKTCFKYKGY